MLTCVLRVYVKDTKSKILNQKNIMSRFLKSQKHKFKVKIYIFESLTCVLRYTFVSSINI